MSNWTSLQFPIGHHLIATLPMLLNMVIVLPLRLTAKCIHLAPTRVGMTLTCKEVP